MLKIKVTGDFRNTEKFLASMRRKDYYNQLEPIARQGVAALKAATPLESGLTAESWDYEIWQTNGTYSIYWVNRHVVDGVSVAILLQYGHGTGTGGYVQGRDYINPALKPVFAEKVWKVVTSA